MEADVTVDIIEDAAERMYYDLQDVPPGYDQLKTVPDCSTSQYRTECTAALEAFEDAAGYLPDEWFFHMRIGEIMKMQGRPPKEYLRKMAWACRCAAVHTKGLIDPIHALHAERLDLVLKMPKLESGNQYDGSGDIQEESSSKILEVLRVVALYCFSKEGQSAVAAALEKVERSLSSASLEPVGKPAKGKKKTSRKESTTTAYIPDSTTAAAAAAALDELKKVLLEDVCAAFMWCLEKDRYYHPASYRSVDYSFLYLLYSSFLYLFQYFILS